MRKLFALSVLFLTIISCSDRDEPTCNCEKQTYFRTWTFTTSNPTKLVSISDWFKKGDPVKVDGGCESNGKTDSYKTGFSPLMIGYQFQEEIKTVITCK